VAAVASGGVSAAQRHGAAARVPEPLPSQRGRRGQARRGREEGGSVGAGGGRKSGAREAARDRVDGASGVW
jgi:hypothetical protein